MAKEQAKRRRKRYQPGSAYAGDVRATGILGFISGARMVKIVFIGMALALVAGGAGALFFRGGGSGGQTQDNFVLPEDQQSATAEATRAVEVRQYSSPPAMVIDPAKRYVATIKTEVGDIEVELLDDQVPQTVNNFVFLAQDGFYDGLAFHFVEAGFSVQAGDPSCTAESTARTCDGGPGYDFQQEQPGSFTQGMVGMVNGSQFFIALSPSQKFEEFTPFGQIISGQELVGSLTKGTAIQTIEIQEL
ncbi:MAG: peptidylprolyl isomerase [Dehalococcoidia bacterium]|nr:peptidylprolyl isomerase [Dehalococcoidia bacterium]